MSLKQKAVKGVFWSAIQSWGSQGIAFLVFALLARLLGPEAFGLVASAWVFLAFIQVFLDQGFSTAIIQRQELEPEHLDTTFWINIVMGLVITGFSIAAAGLVANFFKQPELTPIIRWLSLSFLFIALSSVQEAIFRRRLEFKPLAMRELAAVSAGGIVGVTMAFMGFGVWSLVGQQLVNGLIKVLVLWWASDWRPRLNFSQKHFRELFDFGINIIAINILAFGNSRSDDLLIGYFLGPVALGYYTVAYRLLMVMLQLFTSVTSKVALPVFSKLQQEPERLRPIFYKLILLTSCVSFPSFLVVAVLAPELVIIVFGKQWLPVVPVMRILSLIGIIHSISYFNNNIIMAMGKPFWNLIVNFLAMIINVIGFAIVVRWGIVAVAAVFVIRGYLFLPIYLWLVRKLINIEIKQYLSQLLTPISSSVGMIFVIFAIKYFFSDWLNLYVLLTVCALVGSVVYVVMIHFFQPRLFQQVLNLVKSTLVSTKEVKNIQL
ncbi:putative polysaccharide transport protein [Hyella patelloides LEGE 07179]|uniref:Putative polysaccharide transport protein n=1 Tax=Hyella patelloides LEGE 07179 TaxID=945734 RepID=A0A563VR26_9CYAN|nr:MOP flippase family protein [Hyella patelloides]VEP13840.1 putative polysaccharide transport protein [Hyella patelloides LEGE 07179]